MKKSKKKRIGKVLNKLYTAVEYTIDKKVTAFDEALCKIEDLVNDIGEILEEEDEDE